MYFSAADLHAQPPVDLGAFWAQVRTPLVDPDSNDVTFLWRDDGSEVPALRINRVTDKSRRALGVLEHVAGTDIHVRTLSIPPTLVASYSFGPDLPGPPTGGGPDPLNPEQVLRGRTSLLRGRLAAGSPWESATPGAYSTTQLLGRTCYLHLPGPLPDAAGPVPLLTLFDADDWFTHTPLTGMLADVAILGIGVTSRADRRETLGANLDFLASVATEAMGWAEAQGVEFSRRIISGQSLGGASALLCAMHFPQVWDAVIAQSPSMWVSPGPGGSPADLSEFPDNDWLTAQITQSQARPRAHLTVGTRETAMISHVLDFAHTARAAGWTVSGRSYSGGHDWAWWRTGLIDALSELLGEVVD